MLKVFTGLAIILGSWQLTSAKEYKNICISNFLEFCIFSEIWVIKSQRLDIFPDFVAKHCKTTKNIWKHQKHEMQILFVFPMVNFCQILVKMDE